MQIKCKLTHVPLRTDTMPSKAEQNSKADGSYKDERKLRGVRVSSAKAACATKYNWIKI